MTISFLNWHAVIPGAAALILWIVGMLILRCVNFTSSGDRKDRHKRKLTDHPDLLSQQIEYHNKATYRTLEFYLKVLLAVLAGVGYIVLKGPLDKSGRLLIDAAGWVVVLVSILFCLMVFVHQKSKIQRWLIGYGILSPLFWNETWFFVVGVIIMCSIRGFVGLLLNLTSGK